MILVSSQTEFLVTGQASVIQIALTNTAAQPCTELECRLKLPAGLIFTGGKSILKKRRLDGGEMAMWEISVVPNRTGQFELRRFSGTYFDPRGHYKEIEFVPIELTAHANGSRPVSSPHSEEGHATADQNSNSESPAAEGRFYAELRKKMESRFNINELEGIEFDLGVKPESIPHHPRSAFVIGLIHYFQARDRIEELLNKLEKEEPGVDWRAGKVG